MPLYKVIYNRVIDGSAPDPGKKEVTKPLSPAAGRGGDRKDRYGYAAAPGRRTLNETYRKGTPLNERFRKSRTEDKDGGRPREKKRIVLPFVSRRSDLGQWMYEHRLGVTVTVALYLIALLLFIFLRVSVHAPRAFEGMLIEFPPEEQPQPEPEAQKERELRQDYEKQLREGVKNIAVNENARLDAGLRDDRGTRASDIYNEAKELQDKLNANRQMYEQGLKEEAMIRDSRSRPEPPKGNSDRRKDTKVAGNVTVSYNLPGRTAAYLHIPAYQCEGGGSVVVNITVNRNGRVISASVDRSASSSDPCLTEMAARAARQSAFNVAPHAPDKQEGTISYLFIPQ